VVTYLFDKSALARVGRSTAIDDAFESFALTGRLATCAVVDLEIGFSTRTLREFDSVFADRRTLYHDLALTREVTQRALDVQRELVRRGKHRGPGASDLLVAACAEVHGAVVVHYDKDFDTIASVTKQSVQWIIPRGSAE
jgi:predicted nucleic acid-binding protein